MASPTADNPDRGGLAASAAGLLASLPFLIPIHRVPIASFQSETLAVLFGLLCFGAVLLRNPPLRLPILALAPLGLIAVLALQTAMGRLAYATDGLFAALMLAWAVLLAVAGASLGPASLRRVAPWLLAGACINALAGCVQQLGWWPAFDGWIAAPRAGEGVYGNLAQQNHFAVQLAMGLSACAWLWQAGRLRARAALPIAGLLLTAMALSGARSGLLYVLPVAWMLRRQLTWRWWLGAALVLVLAVVFSPQAARLQALAEAFGPRRLMWQQAWQIFLQSPWLGAGFDQFAWSLTQLELTPSRFNTIDPYAHNLVLQLLAVSGVLGCVVVAAPLALSAWRGWASPWAGAVLLMLFLHSMLEQPLYYAYFLGLAAFVAGAAGRDSIALSAKPAGAVVLILALFGVLKTWRDYTWMEEDVYGPQQDLRKVQLLHANSLFRPWMELAAPAAFVTNGAPVSDKLALSARVQRFAPVAEVMFRHAALLAEAGQGQAACHQVLTATRAWSDEAPLYLERLRQLAERQPATHAVLAACLPPSVK